MMRRLLRPVQVGLLLILLLLLGVISLVWNLVSFVLYPLLREPRRSALGRAGIAYGYRFYWICTRAAGMMHIDAAALDVLHQDPSGLIIAANHPSLLDAMAIVARLPRSVCIMKASLMRNVFLGSGARLAGYIANDSPRQMIRAAVRELQAGGQLVIFPEGTRTTRDTLEPFRPGITTMAAMAGVPIQTVIIETDSPYLGKGWPLWRLAPIPIVFRLRLGKRFEPNPRHAEALAELEAYFREEMRHTMQPRRDAAGRPPAPPA